MKKLAVTIATVLAGGAMISAVNAQTDLSDFYGGAKIGLGSTHDGCSLSSPCDDEATGLGVYGGYDFNDYIALELSADWLGDYEANFLKSSRYIKGDLSAYSITPRFSYPFENGVDVFARLGGAYMDMGSQNDFVPTGGVGVEIPFNDNWSVRAEYQYFANMSDSIIDDMDVSFFSIGLTYAFGAPVAAAVAAAEPEYVEEVAVVEETVVVAEAKPEYVRGFSKQQYDQELFAFNSTKLSAAGKSTLNPLVEVLLKFPDVKAFIVGHTDSIGSEKINQSISEKRANAVAEYLVDQGVKPSQLYVKGMGEADPIASNDTEEGRAKNRRVEVTIPEFEYVEKVN